VIVNTEDFSDEVDEYDNDAMNHRQSIFKRFNINTSLLSPGSRINQMSFLKEEKKEMSFLEEKEESFKESFSNQASTAK
jgi:hypothetical protein